MRTTTPRTGRETLRTLAMLVAAPFVGLAYLVALPFAGLAVLAWMALEAVFGTRALKAVRDVALFVAAPFIGLAYIVLLPVAGLVTLAVFTWKAARPEAPAATPVPAM